MGILLRRALSGWRAPAVLAAGAIGALGAALFMQHGMGVQPCILCIYQRWPYVIAGALALLALVFGRHRSLRVVLLGLAGLTLLADTGIAVFQVGVEHHWWTGTPGCSVPPPAATIEELRARLMEQPVVPCDEVSWSLFGISLAGYNVVLTLALAAFALVAARRAATKPGGRTDAV
jgi:disulfide bond formation protein DsbB